MLIFFIYFFTAVLVLDCLLLVLLVLVQLPKKEAGMGQAFGGAATDALFGAGSGNVLTKLTKWCAGIFFGLAILLTVMGTYKTTSGNTGRYQKLMNETKSTTPTLPPPPAASTSAPAPAPNQPIDLKVPAPAPVQPNIPAAPDQK
ncbi:MAG TPA: preprotein translocase subunit SecG [Candidatus Limnocylindria bacterium]|nr:preprotein translocase subunit SecG [Candidatus Limnocylindria bacterium]